MINDAVVTSIVEDKSLMDALEGCAAKCRARSLDDLFQAVDQKNFDEASKIVGSIFGREELFAEMRRIAVNYRGKKTA